MKFAFLIMGEYLPGDRAEIADGNARIVGARSVEDACAEAERLQKSGVECIELCGAFGKEGAEKVIAATGGKIPVGYVVHLPGQDGLYKEIFGE